MKAGQSGHRHRRGGQPLPPLLPCRVGAARTSSSRPRLTGSENIKGHSIDVVKRKLENGITDRVIAVGCLFMMMLAGNVTKPFGVQTLVALIRSMRGRTGIAVPASRGGRTGRVRLCRRPFFDAHQVDWSELRTAVSPTATMRFKRWRAPTWRGPPGESGRTPHGVSVTMATCDKEEEIPGSQCRTGSGRSRREFRRGSVRIHRRARHARSASAAFSVDSPSVSSPARSTSTSPVRCTDPARKVPRSRSPDQADNALPGRLRPSVPAGGAVRGQLRDRIKHARVAIGRSSASRPITSAGWGR